MKKIALIVLLLGLTTVANAQFLDFSNNHGRLEAAIEFGQAGYGTPRAHFGLGMGLVVEGFYVDFVDAGPQHKYDNQISDTKWQDTVAFFINAGYQIPILSWFRVMPLIGYAQTNEGETDASTLNISDEGNSWYHDYTVTPGTREHYFNYGGGISIQPLKWFSIHGAWTRYGIYGGISLNILSLTQL